jgi:hypothetical protein
MDLDKSDEVNGPKLGGMDKMMNKNDAIMQMT